MKKQWFVPADMLASFLCKASLFCVCGSYKKISIFGGPDELTEQQDHMVGESKPLKQHQRGAATGLLLIFLAVCLPAVWLPSVEALSRCTLICHSHVSQATPTIHTIATIRYIPSSTRIAAQRFTSAVSPWLELISVAASPVSPSLETRPNSV